MIQYISLIFNVILSTLLLILLIYVRKLDYKIIVFNKTRKEFEKLFKSFIESTKQVDYSLKMLKEKSLIQTKIIQDSLIKGQYLIDDIEFLLKKSQTTIDLLEKLQRIDKSELILSEISNGSKNKTAISDTLDLPGLKKVR